VQIRLESYAYVIAFATRRFLLNLVYVIGRFACLMATLTQRQYRGAACQPDSLAGLT